MSTYMSSQSTEQFLQDMMTLYCDQSSPVYPDMDKLREVLTQLSDEQKLQLLQQRYLGLRPLYFAAGRDHSEMISKLLIQTQTTDGV